MEQLDHYRGKRVVVLGLARSGVAVAAYLHQLGAAVIVNDQKARTACPEAETLEQMGIPVICGGHPADLIDEHVALVVKNPGIPYHAAPVAHALDLHIEVVTEVEIAAYIKAVQIIGITGSNGKTTTTTWIGRMLQASGKTAIVAGNIGRPLCEAVLESKPDDWLVVELSSFQLKGTSRFRPQIALLLNVAETHLDYHGTMEDYIASKAKIFANQTAADVAIVNWDDPVCREVVQHTKAKVWAFSSAQRLAEGVFIDPPLADGEQGSHQSIVFADGIHPLQAIVRLDELGLPARYNAENGLAAAAAALAAGATVGAVASELRLFRGVEHRLEFVANMAGAAYYNNSKATNTIATIKAIHAFQQPIVLIAGGQDRGSDYMELLPLLGKQVKAVIALGETRQKIKKVADLAGMDRLILVDTVDNPVAAVEEAVAAAASLAEAGDIVLLSPACASWDMFPSYEERGRMFKQAVHTLNEGDNAQV